MSKHVKRSDPEPEGGGNIAEAVREAAGEHLHIKDRAGEMFFSLVNMAIWCFLYTAKLIRS